MVTLPKTYYDRYRESAAAVQAAREALDAVERRLESYWRALESASRATKGYLRDEHERAARTYREQALEEAHESVGHLSDALGTWWPNVDRWKKEDAGE